MARGPGAEGTDHATRNTHHSRPPPTSPSATSPTRGSASRFIASWRRRRIRPACEAWSRNCATGLARCRPPLELLLQVAELKVLASERGITVIEVKEDKLMLTRNNDYIMVGSKFPRLTARQQAGAR